MSLTVRTPRARYHRDMRALVFMLVLACGPAAFADELFRADSLFGPVVVEEADGLRHLVVGSPPVPQTTIRVGDPKHLEHEYTRLSMAALALVPHARRILVVGLGGGAVPRFLRARSETLAITAVEIDPVVVTAARRFFELPEDGNFRVVVSDARDFLAQSKESWDLIFLDAYAGGEIPAHLTDDGFLQLVRQRLARGGAVASNLWGPPSPQYEGLVAAHRRVFPNVRVVPGRTEGNHLVFAGRHLPTCKGFVDALTHMRPPLPFALADGVAATCTDR